MSKRKIIIEPDPILRKKSQSLSKVDDDLRKLMDQMLETMYSAPGIGLAAVQIGILKRLIVIDVSKEDTEKAIEEIDKIKNLPNGYELLIKFQKANLHIKNNEISDAVLLFNQIHQDKSIDQSYRDIAFLLSIMHQYKQENSIAKLDNIISTNVHFAMLAKELKAYILYDDGKIKGAQNILEEILNSPNISQRSNERISNILKTFEKK